MTAPARFIAFCPTCACDVRRMKRNGCIAWLQGHHGRVHQNKLSRAEASAMVQRIKHATAARVELFIDEAAFALERPRWMGML